VRPSRFFAPVRWPGSKRAAAGRRGMRIGRLSKTRSGNRGWNEGNGSLFTGGIARGWTAGISFSFFEGTTRFRTVGAFRLEVEALVRFFLAGLVRFLLAGLVRFLLAGLARRRDLITRFSGVSLAMGMGSRRR